MLVARARDTMRAREKQSGVCECMGDVCEFARERSYGRMCINEQS